MKPCAIFDLMILLLCVLAGTAVNTLPPPIESSGVEVFGLGAAVFLALRYSPVMAVPAALIICAPVWVLDSGIISKVTLTLLPVVVSAVGYLQPVARALKNTVIWWALPAMCLLLAEHFWSLGFEDSLPITGQIISWVSGVFGFVSGQFAFLFVQRYQRDWISRDIGLHFLFSYLFAGSFFIAVLVIVFTTVGLYQHQERQQLQSYMTQRAKVLNQQLSEFVSHHHQVIIQAGDMLSAITDDKAYDVRARRALRTLNQHTPEFLTFLIADAQGDIGYASPPDLLEVARQAGALNVAGRDYFYTVVETGRPFRSDVFRGRGFGDDPIIALSAPIKDSSGNVTGIIEGSLSLKSFQQFDAQNIAGFSMLLTDANNRVIYASSPLALPPLKAAPDMQCAEECETRVTMLDKQWLYTARGIDSLGWQLRLLFDNRLFVTLSNEYLVSALVVLLVLSAAGTLIGLLVAGMVDSPIKGLARRVIAFSPNSRKVDNPMQHHASYIREIAALDDEFVRLQHRLITAFDELGQARNAQRSLNRELSDFNKTLEQRIAQKTHSLAKALDEANAASVAKTQFLANMSHEIRTPMNGIIGNCELLREQALPPASDARVNVIAQSAMNLLTILDNILDWSKIESGKMRVDNHATQLTPLLASACELYRQKAAQKQVNISLDIDPSVPAWVLIDSGKLSQVLNNLLSNAVKFTTQGTIRVLATYTSAMLKIAVTDTGVGIQREKQLTIFEQFEQADASTTRLFGGTGLGLAISRGLVDAMKGNISVSSTPGQGSCFSVIIPCDITAEKVSDDSSASLPENLRVLLVEDNDINAHIVQDMLKQAQVRCVRTTNGLQALEAVERHRFDCILMDCQMPVMDGLEATRRIRQRVDDNRHIPIIALTANAFNEDRDACIAAGMNDFVTKPVTRQRLFDVIAAMVATHQQA
ncbi:response regulator [Alteromonas halophila]|uniref:histidine kinase n=1 Tax=Alteromonas halophila TaxID=516698 RepID=A0A918JGS5_9ALTE|nr:response regulator [Alteromonas halophila]GGW79313.1 hypothetical protein GCM10007391_10070 [Alteromonas halophila]